MNEENRIIDKLIKLNRFYDEDHEAIQKALQGDFSEAYLRWLSEERTIIRRIRDELI